jgi:hypothetical protein
MNLFLKDGDSVHIDHCNDGVLLVLIRGKSKEVTLILTPEQAKVVARYLVEHAVYVSGERVA